MNCPLKSQKPVPIKAAQVLLIQSGDEWLWQQRPNSGLWVGFGVCQLLKTLMHLNNCASNWV